MPDLRAAICRELAYRESGGISVRLCWRPSCDEIFVEVRGDGEDERFVVNPTNDEALRAFYHPYAIASRVAGPLATRLHGSRP